MGVVLAQAAKPARSAGLAMRRRAVPPLAVAPLLAFLCLAPALAGHPATLDPGWLLVPANFVHVVAMAVWVGGVVVLLVALPAATRALARPDRTRLLAASLTRFSAFALLAVAALKLTGGQKAPAITPPAATEPSDDTGAPTWLAVLALVVGVGGLLTGGAALASTRRRAA